MPPSAPPAPAPARRPAQAAPRRLPGARSTPSCWPRSATWRPSRRPSQRAGRPRLPRCLRRRLGWWRRWSGSGGCRRWPPAGCPAPGSSASCRTSCSTRRCSWRTARWAGRGYGGRKGRRRLPAGWQRALCCTCCSCGPGAPATCSSATPSVHKQPQRHRRRPLPRTQATAARLQEELEARRAELAKVEVLPGKVAEEMAGISARLAALRQELGRVSDVPAAQRSAGGRRLGAVAAARSAASASALALPARPFSCCQTKCVGEEELPVPAAPPAAEEAKQQLEQRRQELAGRRADLAVVLVEREAELAQLRHQLAQSPLAGPLERLEQRIRWALDRARSSNRRRRIACAAGQWRLPSDPGLTCPPPHAAPTRPRWRRCGAT
jgi:hypothetical protein